MSDNLEKTYWPRVNTRVLELIRSARRTLEGLRTQEANLGFGHVENEPAPLHAQETINVLAAALCERDWSQAALALAMLQDVDLRLRLGDGLPRSRAEIEDAREKLRNWTESVTPRESGSWCSVFAFAEALGWVLGDPNPDNAFEQYQREALKRRKKGV